jgi:hypothetical protein
VSPPYAFWKWRFDGLQAETSDVVFRLARRHAGPVSVYRYSVEIAPTTPKGKPLVLTWWMLCPWDGVSFGAHLPDWLSARLNRVFFERQGQA